MRRLLSLVFVFVVATVLAQTSQPNPPTTPPQPDTPFSPRGLPASPVSSGLPASPVNPGLPGFTNSIGPWFTNSMGSNVISADMSALLVNLQNDMQQLLPLLAGFNNNVSGLNSLPAPGPATNRQPNGALFSRDLSSRASQDISTRVWTPPSNINSSTGTTSGGTAIAQGSPVGISNLNGTNSFMLTSAEQDAVRALIILQNDLERSLPVVAALNGGALPGSQMELGANTAATTRSFLGTNNLFILPGSRPAGVTPTGR
jgi:hypothetical protein